MIYFRILSFLLNSKFNQFKNIQELQELGEYSNNFPPTPELEKITFYPNYPVGPRGRNSLEPQLLQDLLCSMLKEESFFVDSKPYFLFLFHFQIPKDLFRCLITSGWWGEKNFYWVISLIAITSPPQTLVDRQENSFSIFYKFIFNTFFMNKMF